MLLLFLLTYSNLSHDLSLTLKHFPHYVVQDGLLFYRNRVVIPCADRELVKLILQEFHSSQIGAHAGYLCTFSPCC